MDMAPRDLPVFRRPAFPQYEFDPRAGCAIENVPGTPAGSLRSAAITVYSFGEQADWSLASVEGGNSSIRAGRLTDDNGFEQRVAIELSDGRDATGAITCNGRRLPFRIRGADAAPGQPVGADRAKVISATATTNVSPDWEAIESPGAHGQALRARLDVAAATANSASLDYPFATTVNADVKVRIIALPVHRLSSESGVRIAVSVDGEPKRQLDFATQGRSEEWKQNVLTNTAVREIDLPQLPPGDHHIRVWAVDPGVVLDRLEIVVDGPPVS